MAEHTPGPWKAVHPSEFEMDARPEIVTQDGKTLIAELFQPLTDQDGPCEGTYNAHLIAAAPDLLAAVDAIFPPDCWEYIEELPLKEQITMEVLLTRDELFALRDAIARAKGAAR